MRRWGRAAFLCGLASVAGAATAPAASQPHVLLVSIDTLRAMNMGSYGYERNTSPNLDRLLESGARFDNARTVEPLTAPALASMVTSLQPHEHGSTRNGLRIRENLFSFSKSLGRRGYKTAAFLGNWTLKPELSGLDEHFDTYETILNRKRWFGLLKSEATADDLVARSVAWLDTHLESSDRPFLLWVHMIEPHAPYRAWPEYFEQIGVKRGGSLLSTKNYDSEIAYADDRTQWLLDAVYERVAPEDVLVVFFSDHGESLGEHGYLGHGRNLYEYSLKIPLGFSWPGKIEPRVVTEPASIIDVAKTTLGLLGLETPDFLGGYDWSGVLLRDEAGPEARVTWHQAHRSSVEPQEDQTELRARGLLQVSRFAAGQKEHFRVNDNRRRLFDLASDEFEKNDLSPKGAKPSPELREWLQAVRSGLVVADDLPPPNLTDDDLDALRALGYID